MDDNIARQRSEELREKGFVVIKDMLSESIISQLMERAAKIVDDFDPSSHSTIFRTKHQEKVTNQYFLDSASNISCFFEADAFSDDNKLQQDKSLSINKIGHALHDIDDVFNNFCRSNDIQDIVKNIINIESPLLIQSMYIFKQPRIGGEVSTHQDNWFIHTNPLSCYGLWFALEDATTENGCLWAIPGSHKEHPCQKRFTRTENKVEMVEVDKVEHLTSDEDFIPLPVPKGSMIILDGGLLHKSYPNTSNKSRQAFTLHIVDSKATYSSDNWLQRPSMPFKGF